MPSFAKDRFLESLARCQERPGFLWDFYERFMDSGNEIRERFRFTAMQKQTELLADGLRVSAGAVEGNPDALVRLRELAESHDRYHHDVKPEWYALWLDALVATAAEADPHWSAEIEADWRSTLGHVVQYMSARH